MRNTFAYHLPVRAPSAHALQPNAGIAGRWAAIHEDTGDPRSTVELAVANATPSGRIIDLQAISKLDEVRVKCPDDHKNQRLVGLGTISGMKADGDEWKLDTNLAPGSARFAAANSGSRTASPMCAAARHSPRANAGEASQHTAP